MAVLPRTIVIGAEGFIGRHLFEHYRQRDPATLGTSRRLEGRGPGLAYLDLGHPDLDLLPLQGHQQAVLAAAIPKVEACEREPEKTRRVNVTGTLEVVRQLQARDILPIFLSSDYVFDGTRAEGYEDDAERDPTTEYGRQKAAVEAELARTGRAYLVLRPGKVFGLTKGDGTLLDEMAASLTAGREVRAARDQVFCPTWIDDLVRGVETVQAAGMRGAVNVCPERAWSRLELALAVARAIGAPARLVREISLDDLPGIARRPKCTRLKPARLTREVGLCFTPMEECLERLAREYRR